MSKPFPTVFTLSPEDLAALFGVSPSNEELKMETTEHNKTSWDIEKSRSITAINDHGNGTRVSISRRPSGVDIEFEWIFELTNQEPNGFFLPYEAAQRLLEALSDTLDEIDEENALNG